MIWSKRKHILALSLAFLRNTQASCGSRLLSCFAFQIAQHEYDYELVYDQIPDGSIDSICNNLLKSFPSKGLDRPGCATSKANNLELRSNIVAFSARRTGYDTTNGFNDFQSAFEDVLECDKNQEFGSCEIVDASTASNVPIVWMTEPGNNFILANKDNLTMTTFTPSQTASIFPNTSDVASAMYMISSQLVDTLSQGHANSLLVSPWPIDTKTSLVATFDIGISNSLNQGKVATLVISDWLVIVQGLVNAGGGSQSGSVAGTYSVSKTPFAAFPDLFVSVAVEQLA
jgi:hypothetical protein